MLKRTFLLLSLVLLLAACGGGRYRETFDNRLSWNVNGNNGVSGGVNDGEFILSVDFPGSMFWTTAGRRNLGNGTFEVEAQVVSGSSETAYGLVFRAEDSARDFYYFLISSDGYYSIGGCKEECVDNKFIPIAPEMWILTDKITPHTNARHNLRVIADGSDLAYYIDGVEVGRFRDTTLAAGDIGLFVQTFDSGATVAFDNLSFTPSD
ncbi:MAG: hypothetical protein ACPG8W_08950 [Candidatus Promineifilaceae bacterium]